MSHGTRLGTLVVLASGVGAAWLGTAQLTHSRTPSVTGIVLVAAALLLFSRALRMAPAGRSHPERAADSAWPALATRMPWSLAAAALLGVAAVVVAPKPAFQPWPALAVWAAALLCFVAGAAQLEPRSALHAGRWQRIRGARLELVALAAVIAVAFALRASALAAIPHNIHGDEGEMGLVARAILGGQRLDPFSTAWLSHPTLWFYLQAGALRVFGNTIGGLRLLSALLGTLAIPALYGLVRPLYGRGTALAAAALLATFHFHVHYSRIGLNNIADPLLSTLVFGAFLHGARTGRPLSFALAGILLGLAQYVYFGSRLVPIILLELLLLLALTNPRQLAALTSRLVLMAAGFVLATGPLIRYFLARPDTFNARLVEHGLLNNLGRVQSSGQPLVAALLNHAYSAVGLFFYSADTTPFYGALRPLLDAGSAVLFLLGLAVIVSRGRQLSALLVVLWVLNTALFGGFLLVDPPQSTRYLIAAPAVCLLVALGAVQIFDLARQNLALPAPLARGALALTVALLMLWNVDFYFWVYTPRNSYGLTEAITATAYYLRDAGPARYLYLLTVPAFYRNHGTLTFIADQAADVDVVEPLTSGAQLPPLPAGMQPVFILIPERRAELAAIQERYPGGQLRELQFQPQRAQPMLYIYEARASAGP